VFTGIVEEKGVLRAVRRGADSARLVIGAEKVLEDIRMGDSIAVNGICLTAVQFSARAFSADVMAETLARTNLDALRTGDRVNLERALRLGDRLGGHLVSGHIDGVGTIVEMKKYDIATLVTIRAPFEVMRYVIKKGSIAIDGASLTVVDFRAGTFQVSLIPHTAHATTLGLRKPGDTVNLEGDIIGKYIERLAGFPSDASRESGIDLGFLAKHGFV